MVTPNDMSRHNAVDLFEGTAGYYARYRVAYPQELLETIVPAFGLNGSGRLLDVGCGTGQLAIPLSRWFEEAVGIDVSPEMIAEAERQAAQAGVTNVRWLVRPAEDISPDLGQFRLVTFGASFHWVDRAVVLARCREVIDPAGGIVVTGTHSFWGGKADWEQAAVQVVQQWLGAERRAGSGSFPAGHERFEDALTSGGFGRQAAGEVRFRYTWDIPGILGHLYSTSYCKRSMLGENVSVFERDMAETLLRLNPAGRFEQEVTADYIFAWRG